MYLVTFMEDMRQDILKLEEVRNLLKSSVKFLYKKI